MGRILQLMKPLRQFPSLLEEDFLGNIMTLKTSVSSFSPPLTTEACIYLAVCPGFFSFLKGVVLWLAEREVRFICCIIARRAERRKMPQRPVWAWCEPGGGHRTKNTYKVSRRWRGRR